MRRLAMAMLVITTGWLGTGHATWTNLWYETLDYTEDDGWRLIDQGSDSQINPAISLADHDLLIVTILTNGHDCCTVNHGAGCSNPTIEEAVCSMDAYCCTTNWDNTCVNQVPDATSDKYFCPVDYSSEDLTVDNGGENGGAPDITTGCGDGGYLCYKTTRIGTMSGGGNGRTPLIVELLPNLDGGWGYPTVNYLVRSLLYRNESQGPDTSVSRSFDVRYLPIGGGSPETGYVYLVLSSVNDPPTVQTNNTLVVDEGSGGNVNSSNLYATDPDNANDEIFWTLRNSAGPLHGMVQLSGSPTFWVRQADINANLVRYQHDGTEDTADSLGFTLTDTHNCCVNAQSTGCSDSGIEACVCGLDSYCCTILWDAICANAVVSNCGATCGATGGNVDFNINVLPVNDPPMVATNTTLTVAEGQTASVSNSHLRATDVDNATSQLLWAVVTPASHGTLRLGSTPTLSVTQAQIDAGLVAYRHDGSETTSDQIVFNLSDGSGRKEFSKLAVVGPVAFNISVIPVNDPPIMITNTLLTVATGHEGMITNAHLETTDPDNTPVQLVYTVTTDPLNGELHLASVGTTSFSQAEINSGLLSYVHDGSATLSDAFVFVVSDGAEVIGANTFNIVVSNMIFSDDFESGNTCQWSAQAGGPPCDPASAMPAGALAEIAAFEVADER